MPIAAESPRQVTEHTLLGYLQTNKDFQWPGVDGLTLQDVLDGLSDELKASFGR